MSAALAGVVDARPTVPRVAAPAAPKPRPRRNARRPALVLSPAKAADRSAFSRSPLPFLPTLKLLFCITRGRGLRHSAAEPRCLKPHGHVVVTARSAQSFIDGQKICAARLVPVAHADSLPEGARYDTTVLSDCRDVLDPCEWEIGKDGCVTVNP